MTINYITGVNPSASDINRIVAQINNIITTISGAGYTGTGPIVRQTNPALITPDLGTPSALVGTNITGTALGLTAGHVTTNANLTGPITSVGNATTIASSVALPGSPTTTTQSQGDASTKISTTAYVDTAVSNAIAGVNPAVAVLLATTAAGATSGLTYNNGAAGVGATLTGSINVAITIDGTALTTVGQRVLVKNDTQSPSGAYNGVYTLTQVQTVGLPPILTRATDYNQPSDINYTGAIPVISGTANAGTTWVLNSQVTTIGTDALSYTKFSLNPSTVLTTTLTSAHILVGNGSNIATDVAVSGDGTLANTGALTINTLVGDSGSGGTKGLVPAPAAGDAAANKFLKASGAWVTIAATTPGGSTTQVQYNSSSAFAGAAGLTIDANGFPTFGSYSTTDPTSPAAGTVTAFTRSRARDMLSSVDSNGLTFNLNTHLHQDFLGIAKARGNNTTTYDTIFSTAFIGTGTVTAVAFATTNFSTALRQVQWLSNAGAGSSAGRVWSDNFGWLGNGAGLGGFEWRGVYNISQVQTGMRWFCGLTDSTAAIGNVDPSSLANTLGFGIDAGQTTIRFFNNDGSGTATATNLGANFPATTANEVYEFRIWCPPNGSTIYYSCRRLYSSAQITDGNVNSNIPSATTKLYPQFWINNGATAAAVAINESATSLSLPTRT